MTGLWVGIGDGQFRVMHQRLRTIGGVDFTRQERATLNKLTMPSGRFYERGMFASVTKKQARASRCCSSLAEG